MQGYISAGRRADFRRVEAALLATRGNTLSEAVRPARFAKRIFYIEAVQVTSENMEQAAEWCSGEVMHTKAKPEENYPASPFVKVKVKNPRNPRQTRAFVNDWIIKDETGCWRVYPNKAFALAFEAVRDHDNLFVTK